MNITIIAFVRDPICFFMSVFQQLVKEGVYFSDDHLDIISKFCSAPALKLEKFIHVFGEAKLNVFKFEDAVTHPYFKLHQ